MAPSQESSKNEEPASRADARSKPERRRVVGKPDDLKPYFDEAFYLKSYPEIAEFGIAPLMHYWKVGWTEGRDPSPGFSTTFYLKANPDVANSRFNPFWHYIKIGRKEERLPVPPPQSETTEGQRAKAGAGAGSPKRPGRPEDLKEHFDEAFYLKSYPEVAESGMDPLTHYWTIGWSEGRDPTAEFSSAYYLSANPDVARSHFNPFWHYIRIGKKEGRRPRPAAKERAGAGAVPEEGRARSLVGKPDDLKGYFDEAYYLATYPEVAESGMEPLLHYWTVGWKEGRDPTADFSSTFYLEANPDVARSPFNPFWHYIRIGRNEGRPARPVAGPSKSEPAAATAAGKAGGNVDDIRKDFDEAFYLKSYPEVAGSGMDPLTHFWTIGWTEGRDPNGAFSTSYYLASNKDVSRSGVHPFWHYVVAGRKEGRPARPPKRMAGQGAAGNMEDVRPHFDPVFYLARYPDVARAGIDPLLHYWTSGWKEGRDPSPSFSTRFYLENSPDIAAAKVNPFWHYVVTGRREGRLARHPGGPRVDRLRTAKPFESKVRAWRSSQPIPPLLDGEAVRDRLAGLVAGAKRLIVSVGHDRYRKTSGGVQLCIHREEALAVEEGSAYLYIHPVQALPRMEHLEDEDDVPVGIVVNGTEVGASRISALIAAVADVRPEVAETAVVIHHLLGHLPERIAELIEAAGRRECFMWAHDFFAACPGYTLQRNDVAYCGAPPVHSNACALCSYGGERVPHLSRMEAFFAAVDVHLLAPSEVALATWTESVTVQPASTAVVSHMSLSFVPRSGPAPEEPVKPTIAFLGTVAPHKGWDVFAELVRRDVVAGGRFRFVYCGTSAVPASGIDHVPVHVTAENRDAMIETVAREGVDLVLHWASWPETFSLSTYEALAGGAFVITNPVSGNVAASVRAYGRGAVLDDEADLYAFFEDGRCEALIEAVRAERRAHVARHALSRMTYEKIEEMTLPDAER